MTSPLLLGGFAALALLSVSSVRAQATVKPDGIWRASLGVSASTSSGNSKSSNLAILGDAVRASAQDKISLYGSALRATSDGTKTADQVRAGGRYEWNIGPAWYAFGSGDVERDPPANLQRRGVLGGGLGWHVVKAPEATFDIFGGLGYTSDRYEVAAFVDGRTRTSYGYATAMLGEESTHQFSGTTTAKQRLAIYPNLSDSGEYRATWDAALAVAMTKTLNLTAGFSARYNSAPGAGRRSTDTLFTTGIAMKFE